jgi:hypothetical protein
MFGNAMAKYKANFVEDNSLMAAIWIPINTFNFKYVPLHFRQPFMSACGFFWAAALSFITGMRKEGQAAQPRLPISVATEVRLERGNEP